MNAPGRPPVWLAVLVGTAAVLALYWGALGTGFLNDDYLFLEAAREERLADSIRSLDPLGNYYRPLARQVYFEGLQALGGADPRVFHAANALVFLAALALLADLLRALVPWPGVMAGLLYFVLLPFQRVNMIWISCSQDLLALAFSLGAIALHRRERRSLGALAWLLALASKESAVALPLALVAWDVWIARRDWSRAVLRQIPYALAGLAWGAVWLAVRAGAETANAFFRMEPLGFVAAWVHLLQALLGLDDPPGFLPGMLSAAPALVPLALLAALAWWLQGGGRGASDAERPRAAVPFRDLARFALVWLLAFGFVVGPIVHTWSSYHYTLAAAGGAMFVGASFGRIGRPGWLVLAALLTWWHAGANATRAFATRDDAWGWTSHLTSAYFERGAALTSKLARDMRALEPDPPPHTRFFFALLPPWAGFQMGNGPLLRHVYRDPTLASYFYSQFDSTTAENHPCRFLWWDGETLAPLYGDAPFFRVGCDLLLLDRPAGAAHAFQRGLAGGENPVDLHYWLGWADLWRGRRSGAEAHWRAFGARDDSLRWITHLAAARRALLVEGDTLAAQRELLATITHGMGRPEGHAALGDLLHARGSRFGLLELKVASSLDPRDWRSRRDLAIGLVEARLDAPAARVFREIEAIYPEWRSDPALARARTVLEGRAGGAVVEAAAPRP